MGVLEKLQQRIRQKGFKRVCKTLFERYVFFHWELLWTERDLTTPAPEHRLRAHPPVTRLEITPDNVEAFAANFGDRMQTMAELAQEGHTGLMYVDEQGQAVAFIWASTGDYHDRHYYGCTFAIEPGEYFQFGGEMTRRYFGSELSVTAQADMWQLMHDRGYRKLVDVVETHNVPAMKMHLRMGYREQGRVTHIYGLFGRWKFSRQTRYRGARLEALRTPGVTRPLSSG